MLHGDVVRTERLTPSLVRVILGGPGLADFVMAEGTDAYVNLALPRTDAPDEAPVRRRYTVRHWDDVARELTIDFVVHGDTGVAGPWALQAQVGDVLSFTGPSAGYTPDPEASWHLMVGDESAFPAIAASLESLPASATAHVVLLCDGPEHRIDLPAWAAVQWLDRSGSTDQLADAVAALAFPAGRVHAFVHGEAEEIRSVRRHLLGERALTRADMSCSPYWRRTMTDEAWRAVKRDFVAAMESDA